MSQHISHRHNHVITLIALAALALSALACNAAAFNRAAPPPTIQPSAEALASFNDKWRDLSLATPDGPFTMTFTEAELTSAVNAAIDDAEIDSGQPLPLSNVSVGLRNGQITVYGSARIDPLAVNGSLSVVPTIDQSGRVRFNVANVDFGPLTLNDVMLNDILSQIEQGINAPIQSSPFNITLTAITVGDGQLTLNGTIQ